MKPPTYQEQDRVLDEHARLCREAGINCSIDHVNWAGELAWCPEGRVVMAIKDDEITFEMLSKASLLMGTAKIDVGPDKVNEDDCQLYVTFWGARGL